MSVLSLGTLSQGSTSRPRAGRAFRNGLARFTGNRMEVQGRQGVRSGKGLPFSRHPGWELSSHLKLELNLRPWLRFWGSSCVGAREPVSVPSLPLGMKRKK